MNTLFNTLESRSQTLSTEHIEDLPTHIALIPDGNRRWARENDLPYEIGYRKGVENIFNFIEWCGELKIKYVSVWAVSTENFKRVESEKMKLFEILKKSGEDALRSKKFDTYGIRVQFLGDIYFFPEEIRCIIHELEEKTKSNTEYILSIFLGYGGRREILNTVKKIAIQVKEGKVSLDDIDERYFSSMLYTQGIPDPDIVIRTSENRLSGFMPWQTVYSEIYFVDKYWPDFNREDLLSILSDYDKSERRFGR